MFWMRNKENCFPISTLIWKPVLPIYKINQPCPLVAIKFVSAIFAEGHSEDWFQRRKCLASYKGIYGNRPHTLVALFYCGSNLF